MITFVQIGVVGFVFALGFVACHGQHGSNRTTKFRQLADRVVAIRQNGQGGDSFSILKAPVRITEDDYFLMGCDNSSTIREHPDRRREELTTQRWYRGAPDLKRHSWNSHETQRPDGSWEVDSFLTEVPNPQFYVAPEEVAWHYLRVVELRNQGVPIEERKQILKAEAVGKPWLTME